MKAIILKINSIKVRLKGMRHPLTPYLLILIPYLSISCEKDIDLVYHQVDPIYVVEASLSNTMTEVRISQTNAMEDNSSKSNISQAKVTITSDNGNI